MVCMCMYEIAYKNTSEKTSGVKMLISEYRFDVLFWTF